ncbi:NADH-quinone oxidoreductase subunit L, partial [Klebsiella pneumoniae]
MLWSLFGLPLVVGVALLVAGHRADRHAAVVSIATSVVVLGVSIAVAIIRPAMSVPYLRGITFGLRV